MVAYHSGKAAKVAPPAVSSQTSLPSQTEPIELMMARRSVSFLPRKGRSMPTPKSKPSRKKKPIHNMAIRINQRIWRNSYDMLSLCINHLRQRERGQRHQQHQQIRGWHHLVRRWQTSSSNKPSQQLVSHRPLCSQPAKLLDQQV